MLKLEQQYVFLSVDKQHCIRTKTIQAGVHHLTARKSPGNHKDRFKSTVWKFLHRIQASF